MRMVRISFSTTGKSIKSSRSHSASTVDVPNAVTSASIADLVKRIYLQDFHETAPPPRVNKYPLMASLVQKSLLVAFEKHH